MNFKKNASWHGGWHMFIAKICSRATNRDVTICWAMDVTSALPTTQHQERAKLSLKNATDIKMAPGGGGKKGGSGGLKGLRDRGTDGRREWRTQRLSDGRREKRRVNLKKPYSTNTNFRIQLSWICPRALHMDFAVKIAIGSDGTDKRLKSNKSETKQINTHAYSLRHERARKSLGTKNVYKPTSPQSTSPQQKNMLISWSCTILKARFPAH